MHPLQHPLTESTVLLTCVSLNIAIQPPPPFPLYSSPSPPEQWLENCTLWSEIKTTSFRSLSSLTAHHFGVPPKVKSVLSESFISRAFGALSGAVSQGSQGRAVIHK